MHQVHQINQVIIFSVGTRQFDTKFMKNIHENRLCVLGTFVVYAYESLIVFVSQLVHIVQILTFFIDVY